LEEGSSQCEFSCLQVEKKFNLFKEEKRLKTEWTIMGEKILFEEGIYLHGKSRGHKGCITQYILTSGSVKPFSHHQSLPRDVSGNPSIQSDEH